MNLLGLHLKLMIGREIPSEASPFVVENLRRVEVTHRDEGPSGFQMTFHIGRTSAIDLLDYRLLTDPSLKPFSRVILQVHFDIVPVVLMDGIITNQQLNPGNEPGTSTLTVTGEDVSVMMDLEAQHREFPGHFDYAIVQRIVGNYGKYLTLLPIPMDSATYRPVNTLEAIPQKSADQTDRAFLQNLALRYGFLFYVTPGPGPLTNSVHWGPPVKLGVPQSALSVNQGPNSNVETISFNYDGMRPQRVEFLTNTQKDSGIIDRPSGLRNINLARNPAEPKRLTYLTRNDARQVRVEAQGIVDRSFDEVVTATGELDALRYNKLLMPRSLVEVRGTGDSYSGNYYVKSVTHRIEKGRYTQGFTLTREGTGTLVPVVRS
jgi:hypothetical protein